MMLIDPSTLQVVSSPRDRAFLTALVESDLAPAEQYSHLLAFFQKEGDLSDFLAILRHLKPAAVGEINAPDLPARLMDSHRRVIGWLHARQRVDGSWGPLTGEGTLWLTLSAVQYLTAIHRFPALCSLINEKSVLLPGWAYVEQHLDDWAASSIGAHKAISVYDLCQTARAFFDGGREFLRRETGVRIYRSLEYLYHAQNEDGGWDACLWGYDVHTPIRVFSEVGATSAVVRALMGVGDERLEQSILRAQHWLVRTQNMDGSWNNGACRPDLPAFHLTGDPRASKTCDAIAALLASRPIDSLDETVHAAIRSGLGWLLLRTTPLLAKPLNPAAWAWGYTAEDYENIMQVLEVLLALPQPPLALLAQYAAWLIQGQHRIEGDSEDGSWVLASTARIALALERVLALLA